MKTDKHRQRILEELRKTPIVEMACRNADVGRTTFYEWYKRNRKFRDQVEQAMFASRAAISELAESKLITAIKNDSFKDRVFWLMHNHPVYMTRPEARKPILELEESKKVSGFDVTVRHTAHSPTIMSGPERLAYERKAQAEKKALPDEEKPSP